MTIGKTLLLAAVLAAAAEADLRLRGAAFLANGSAGTLEPGFGDPDIGVRRKRIAHQAVEHRIVV